MSWRTEKTDTGTDIVVDGLEKGIGPNPFSGIADIRNSNLISVPGQASVNFNTTAVYQTPITAAAYTVTAGNDTFTYGGTLVQLGTSVVFTVSTGSGNVVNGTNYWVRSVDLINRTFTISASVNAATGGAGGLFDVSTDGTGTFSTVNLGQINQYAQTTPGGTTYAIDSNGRAWVYNSDNYLIFLGNTTLTNASGGGIAVWHGFIFVFRNALIDYCANTGSATWTYGWKTMNSAASFPGSHQTLVGQDDELYWCDGHIVGSLMVPTVTTTFDPTNSATYTLALSALTLPLNDTINCLAYLGDNLLCGGTNNYIYSWNRIVINQYTLILISENNIHKMVTANTNVYIFAGSRGRIYITNGAQADLYMKVPDHLSNTIEPNLAWGGVMFNRNQLYFGLTAFDPTTGNVINQYGGVWAIDVSAGYGGSWLEVQSSNVMRHVNILSYGTYAGYMSAIVALKVNTTASGVSYDTWAFACGWYDGVSVYGQDISFGATGLATPYSNYESYFISDAIPVGTILNKKTFSQVEWKSSVPLGSSSEAVRLSYRTDRTTGDSSTWTVIGTTTGAISGTMSDAYAVNFQESQWLQIKCEMKASTSTPTFVPIKELRIR